jgi:hypothetical protein
MDFAEAAAALDLPVDGASQALVHRAYRKRARAVHPDAGNTDPDAAEAMGRLKQARDTLLAHVATQAERAMALVRECPRRGIDPMPDAPQDPPDSGGPVGVLHAALPDDADDAAEHTVVGFRPCGACGTSGFDRAELLAAPGCEACASHGHVPYLMRDGRCGTRLCARCYGTGRRCRAEMLCATCRGTGEEVVRTTVRLRVPPPDRRMPGALLYAGDAAACRAMAMPAGMRSLFIILKRSDDGDAADGKGAGGGQPAGAQELDRGGAAAAGRDALGGHGRPDDLPVDADGAAGRPGPSARPSRPDGAPVLHDGDGGLRPPQAGTKAGGRGD